MSFDSFSEYLEKRPLLGAFVVALLLSVLPLTFSA